MLHDWLVNHGDLSGPGQSGNSQAETPPSGAAQQVVSLDAILMAAWDSLQADTADRSIAWRAGELGDIVCNPQLMQQLFVNLLSNALTYTRNCAPAVIQTGAFEFAGEQVVFVRDNGTGFDVRYDTHAGAGIELATVSRIIRWHGGRVWANADDGAGATFYFTVRMPQAVQCAVTHRPAGS